MVNNIAYTLLFTLIAWSVAACGGNDDGAQATMQEQNTSTTASAADTVTIRPVGNQMLYEQTEFTVQAGQEVTIVFENTATSPAMQHNVVVLNTTEDAVVNRVGQAAIQAGADQDYVPEDEAILAHTPMAQPEETVSITFTVPSEPGDYQYICTFPGHYQTMQGTMHVVE